MRNGSGVGAGWVLGFLTLGLAALFTLRASTPALAVSPTPVETPTTQEPVLPEVVPIVAGDRPGPSEAHRLARQSRRGSPARDAKQRSRRF
jgi:hypothetical protein